MNDEALYEQYLKETGQKSAPPSEPASDNWKKLSQLGGIAAPGSEWSLPDSETLSDPTIKEALKSQAKTGLGAAAAGAAGEIPALSSSVLRRSATGGLINAAQEEGGLKDRLKAFLLGSIIQGGVEGLGKLAGKAGDVGMQIAVGRKKYTPGVGTELANQGLVGTRGMMADQTENKLGEAGDKMLRAANSANPIDSRAIGESIYDTASKPLATDGMGRIMQFSERDRPAMEAIRGFADDVASRGEESAIQGMGRRRAAGSSAYSMKSGDPKQSQMAQLSKLEQQKYSQALKASDPTGQLAEADNSYSALKRGQRSLQEEPSLTGLGLISRPVSTLGGAAMTSLGSQAAVKGGKLAEFLAPAARQAAAGGMKDPGPSSQELSEYQQYLKETGQGN